MRAILLVNMGSPTSEVEMKQFLRRMFLDRAIIDAPKPIRLLIAFLITNLRYRSSWQKYIRIGGSPLLTAMDRIRSDLAQKLPEGFLVKCAYSYSPPLIETVIDNLSVEGITDFTIISMYPQASYSTTGSIDTTLRQIVAKRNHLAVDYLDDYHQHPDFIAFWTDVISKRIAELGYSNPYLVFSAHAIPEYHVRRGDGYPESVARSAEMIASQLNLNHCVSYQSKLGWVRWTTPSTLDTLDHLLQQKAEQILIVPISFISENLETLFDVDVEILPYARNVLGIQMIDRVILPEGHPSIINLFTNLIHR